jgi:hypothetical protein
LTLIFTRAEAVYLGVSSNDYATTTVHTKEISQDSSYLRNTVVDMIDKDSDSQIEYHELP